MNSKTKQMRFEGTLKLWNDERGFGFIEPIQGGQEIFVHIKAFPIHIGRPQLGMRLTFEVQLNTQGRMRAVLVEPFGRSTVRSPKRKSESSYFAIPAFGLVYFVATVLWQVPSWVAGLYAVASLICFIFYAADKSAAAAGHWRIAESTLIFLGLIGGWPGAIVAQQVLRHKSSKAEFLSLFWGSVFLNVVIFVALNSPLMLLYRS